MKTRFFICFLTIVATVFVAPCANQAEREADLDLLRQLHRLPDARYNSTVEAIVADHADLAKVGSIGTSREGRRITLLTITDFAHGGENKPAYFIQGHIHSKEMSGTVSALHLIKRLLRDPANRQLLRQFVFYFVPRCNPDGAQRITDRPGDERSGWGELTHLPNAFEPCDVNGDGMVTMMRKEATNGTMIACDNGLGMRGRGKSGKTPAYFLMMEGVYHDWDGKFVGRSSWWREWNDWNRNWPWHWRLSQRGAGKAPLCEREVRLQHDWILAHRNIKASICLHNGWGSVMMPEVADKSRYAEMRDLAKRAGELCGQWVRYDQTPPPSDASLTAPSNGTFDDWMMNGFGVPCLTIELGTRETSAGVSSEFCFTTKSYPYDNIVEVIDEQKSHPEFGICIFPWKKAVHPQLGEVEIGGACPSLFACPTAEYLLKVTDGVYDFLLEHSRKIIATKGVGK